MIDIVELKKRYDYDPDSGFISPKPNEFGLVRYYPRRIHKSRRAIRVHTTEYTTFYIDGASYSGHRIAWAMYYGEWPKGIIDHVNGDKSDNRITNLREANHSENIRNMGLSSRNTSGFKGVSFNKHSGKWIAGITVYEARFNLGSFDTPEEAHKAYCVAGKKYHKEFFNSGV